jgi:TRAP-type C4-dicarboxylate transport system permease small subunit
MEENSWTKKGDWLDKILDGIITTLFFVILMLTIILVILRYVFNSTIIGGNELMEYLFIYTTALGAALAIGRREHIKIMYFVDKLPAPIKAIVEVIALLLVAFINVVIFKLSFAWIMKVGMAESPVMRVPMRTIEVSVPIGCGLAVFYCLFDSWKILKRQFFNKGGTR